jgi:hypothetical protein
VVEAAASDIGVPAGVEPLGDIPVGVVGVGVVDRVGVVGVPVGVVGVPVGVVGVPVGVVGGTGVESSSCVAK